jgi:predicted dehydrogenase
LPDFRTEGTGDLNPLRINKQLHGNLVNVAHRRSIHPRNSSGDRHENELRHFLAAVRGVHPVISTADESTQRMRIIEAAYKSARTGKEIILS